MVAPEDMNNHKNYEMILVEESGRTVWARQYRSNEVVIVDNSPALKPVDLQTIAAQIVQAFPGKIDHEVIRNFLNENGYVSGPGIESDALEAVIEYLKAEYNTGGTVYGRPGF